jgi:hypothetical protein
LRYTPVADKSGSVVITVTVRDAGLDGTPGNEDDGEVVQTFTVRVDAVNDAPTLDPIGDPAAIVEDAGEQTVALSGITAGGGENQTLSVMAFSGDTALIPNPTVSYTSPNPTGSLRYKPVANMSGTALITVTVRDAGLDGNLGTEDDGTVMRTFTVEVLRDFDGDGIPDIDDPDDDNDGMEDWWELLYGLDPERDDAVEDLDRDGLSNLQEYLRGTNPLKADSDGDGIGDATEVSMGADPLDPDVVPANSLKTGRLRVTDVTRRAFSAVWVTNQAASCLVNVYSDPEGESLVRGLTIIDESADHPLAAENGVMKVRVVGLRADTPYYFQIMTVNDEGMLIEPAGGDLPSVRTEVTSQLVNNDVLAHRILMSDGSTPALGALLLAEVEGADYPVTGWVDEGFDAPWALVDLNNLYDKEEHANLELNVNGGATITLESIGGLMGFRRLIATVPAEIGVIQPLDPEPEDDECTLDNAAPVIEQLSPTEEFINVGSPLISGRYSDVSDINLGSVILEVDGADVTGLAVFDSTGIQYTSPEPLSEGIHNVTLSVSDEWGYEADPVTWSFTVDVTAPIVTITDPVNGDYLYPANQTVTWSVVDANLSGVTVFLNGTPNELAPDVVTFDITLDPGENVIEVTARDRAGNLGTDTVQVNLDLDTDGDGIGNYYDPDDDNDLMPDSWETANDLDPFDPLDAAQDKDEDGYSNLTEYLAGTDPAVKTSYPQMTFLVKHIMVTDVTPDGLSVVWQSSKPATCSLVVYDGTGMPLSDIDIVSESASHAPAEDRGVMKVRVSGLQPATTYRIRTLTTLKEDGGIDVAPLDPDFLEVETESPTSAVQNYLISQRIYDENGDPADGALLVASVDGGRYPVTAWVGEGEARVDLNEVYSKDSYEKLELLGGEELTLWSFGGLLGNYVNVQKTPDPSYQGDVVTAIPAESFLSRDEGFYLDLKWDLNIVGIPVHSTPAFDSYSLLLYLREQGGGDDGVVEMIQRHNSETGEWETAAWMNGAPWGDEFPIKAGEAYLIYMGRDLNDVWFEGPARGAAMHLSEGLNLITLPSAQEDFVYRSYEMLEDLGDQTQVSSTRRYDSVWGWETTSWFRGVTSGVNFNARNGEGYLIYMKQEKVNWRPY